MQPNPQTVLVTGGAGFIGSHLTDALLAAGQRVRVLDNFATGYRENLAHCLSEIELIEGDIRDPGCCQEACKGAHVIYHQAALGSVPRSMKDPATTIDVNVRGSANIFAAARDGGCKRVVYASSSSVYGDDQRLPKKEGNEGQPLSPYALSKSMVEQLATVFASCFDMDLIGLRYFNVYGSRQSPVGPYAAVIPRFFEACSQGKGPTIFGDGSQSRDFTHVSDVVQANLLAGASSLDGSLAMNIGAGGSTTVLQLAEAIVQRVGSDKGPEHLEPRPGDVLHSSADASLAFAKLGWQANMSLEDGLAATWTHG